MYWFYRGRIFTVVDASKKEIELFLEMMGKALRWPLDIVV
jgi:hypothetical protein